MAYAVRSDIEARFGKTNVNEWADLDNAQVEADITARITAALAQATSDVDDSLRDKIYSIPVANVSAVVPLAIVDITAKLAAVWLYELKGTQDFNPVTGQVVHRLIYHKTEAAKLLYKVNTGEIVLDAVRVDNTTAPEVIV